MIAILAMAATGVCLAETTWVRCDYCTPAMAEQMAAMAAPSSFRGIYNLPQNWASKFEISREQVGMGCATNGKDPSLKGDAKAGGACTYQNVAYPVPLASDESSFFADLYDFYIATGGTLKESIDVDAAELGLPGCPQSECVSAGMTAYDVARNFGVEQRVREYTRRALQARRAAGLRLIDWIVARLEAIFHGIDTYTRVVVRFTPGGSTAVIEFTPETPHGVVTGTFDPDGNPVWRNASDAREGEGEFSHGFSVTDFLEHARRLGIPVVDAGVGPRYACRSDGANGIVCHRI
ncbi:MAG: hypothetical protein IPK27_06000 [Rhodanobacteraceae bacterium]|nr:hypothetical protein [Rhodanobacteraceae bacterium]